MIPLVIIETTKDSLYISSLTLNYSQDYMYNDVTLL